MAETMALQGQAERAARLFGAAAALRAAHGIVLRPCDHALHERTLAAARGLLGGEAFAAAWAAGQALSQDGAIAEALAVSGEGDADTMTGERMMRTTTPVQLAPGAS